MPEELIFDSKLTTHANLNELERQGVKFITLRRRGPKLLDDLLARPRSAWRRITLEGVSRTYNTPRILDEHVTLTDYAGPIRQIAILDLGHEEPTLLLTNQLRRSAAKLIGRYARRMLIENNIGSSVSRCRLLYPGTAQRRVPTTLARPAPRTGRANNMSASPSFAALSSPRHKSAIYSSASP